MSTSPPDRKPFLTALAASRFPPALIVVFYHVLIQYEVLGQQQLPDANPAWHAWCARGAAQLGSHWFVRNVITSAPMTLSFFFTLSGFILAYTYLSGERTTKLDRWDFWAARVARVYPVLLLSLFLCLPLLFVLNSTSSSNQILLYAVASILLLQAWSPLSALAWNPPAWSLSCEAFFYACFPKLAAFLDRQTPRKLLRVMLIAWLISLTVPITYLVLQPDGPEPAQWTSGDFWLKVLKYNPLLRLPEFVVGVALGKLFLIRSSQTEHVPNSGGGGWLSSLSIIGIFVVWTFSADIPYVLLHNCLFTPLFASMIYGLALGGGPFHWVLSLRPMVVLGDATYGMYLLHIAIIEYSLFLGMPKEFDGKPNNYTRDFTPVGLMWFCMLTSIISSVLIYKFYEVPARRWIRRFFHWLRGRSVAAVDAPRPALAE